MGEARLLHFSRILQQSTSLMKIVGFAEAAVTMIPNRARLA